MTRYLLDVNILVALADDDHRHYGVATNWLNSLNDAEWGPCAFSQAGFLRTMTNPKLNGYSIEHATESLISFTRHRGYRFWPIGDDWISLADPFLERIFGHQQITDGWLLGLAVKEGGVLVTFDKALKHMAGTRFANHLLLLA